MLIGAGVATLVDHPRTGALLRAIRAPKAALQLALAALLLVYPLSATLPYLAASRRTMTNDVLVAWAAANVPRGATVLVSPFYLDSLRQLDLRIVGLAGAAESQYRFDDALGTNSERRPLFRPSSAPR